ncbi:MAG: lipocalin-like domain-containing protein [Ardenticatenaceae bacterium]|nr:lipocalin-like domain-containing protein [Anaerolineales bacterium]MCB8920409.1 lipocalin-like domain-containing protein [Ardenticatenaceae bacterium]MCB8989364.1 lipocalin-like domain-containing protein [Ardenticatenaceae bacterium]MCB9004519.1 lipocalin-like domain-containing protein [Ardenticatenaceae bacterium]
MSRSIMTLLVILLLGITACSSAESVAPTATAVPPTISPTEPPPPTTTPEPVNPLVGAWHLVSWHLQNAAGETFQPFGSDPIGLIMYDELGNISLHVAQRDRPPFTSDNLGEASSTEKVAGFDTYLAGFGTYEFDETDGIVRQTLMGSTFPNWVNIVQVRYVTFEGDTMTLVSEEMAGGVVQTLVWQR